MLPDVLGYKIDDGINLLKESGVDTSDIIINEYYSPKVDIIGIDKRIIKISEKNGKTKITVSSF